MKKDTLLTHAGRDPRKYEGMVNMPVFRTSTVIFPSLEQYETREGDDFKSVRYGRHGTPTTFALEEAVAKMEGGYQAVAVPSGLAAIAAAISAFAKSGDHLLISDSVYAPTRNFCERQLRPNGVAVQYYDPLIGAGIEQLLQPDTRAIFCETPGSLTFEMQDIPAIARAAHARGLPVLADNTWGTPYFFRSFERGVDVSIHSATKYIAGHSDVMMGIIVTNDKHWLPVRKTVADYGYSVSPEDCYLALRGFRTIGVRMKQQMQNALQVARWLESRPEVKRVLYPALQGDPGYPIWKRDFDGAAALFSFVLNPVGGQAVAAFVNALELFSIGSSWGGYESLVTVARIEKYRTATEWNPGGPTLRLHIGLEDPDDLVADLERGLAKLRSV
ncbi:MAG: cystathionine beta-lyase [Betaproteobacteria bacterium RIFCSPLOWO2_12_FULL_62_13]|nr:MAG: cystathionine beta-lyase [Betaproteobacteria bacterium RIFCSPLOWO2_12_FULL_62_13]